jgi:hypothetical protein
VIRIAISVEAFEAIAKTLPLGSVGYEAEAKERGERTVSLEEVYRPLVLRRVARVGVG